MRRWLMRAGLSRWSTGTKADVPLWLKFILSSAAVVNGSSVNPYRSLADVWYSYDCRRRRRMKNASPTSAMPTTTPMTMPAMAPPEMPPPDLSLFSSLFCDPAVGEAELCASDDADVMLVPDVRVGCDVVGEPDDSVVAELLSDVSDDDPGVVLESVVDVDVEVVEGVDDVVSDELGVVAELDGLSDETAELDPPEEEDVAELLAPWVEYELAMGEPLGWVAWKKLK